MDSGPVLTGPADLAVTLDMAAMGFEGVDFHFTLQNIGGEPITDERLTLYLWADRLAPPPAPDDQNVPCITWRTVTLPPGGVTQGIASCERTDLEGTAWLDVRRPAGAPTEPGENNVSSFGWVGGDQTPDLEVVVTRATDNGNGTMTVEAEVYNAAPLWWNGQVALGVMENSPIAPALELFSENTQSFFLYVKGGGQEGTPVPIDIPLTLPEGVAYVGVDVGHYVVERNETNNVSQGLSWSRSVPLPNFNAIITGVQYTGPGTGEVSYTLTNDGNADFEGVAVGLWFFADSLSDPPMDVPGDDAFWLDGPIAMGQSVSGSATLALPVAFGQARLVIDTHFFIPELDETDNITPAFEWVGGSEALPDLQVRIDALTAAGGGDIIVEYTMTNTGVTSTGSASYMLDFFERETMPPFVGEISPHRFPVTPGLAPGASRLDVLSFPVTATDGDAYLIINSLGDSPERSTADNVSNRLYWHGPGGADLAPRVVGVVAVDGGVDVHWRVRNVGVAPGFGEIYEAAAWPDSPTEPGFGTRSSCVVSLRADLGVGEEDEEVTFCAGDFGTQGAAYVAVNITSVGLETRFDNNLSAPFPWATTQPDLRLELDGVTDNMDGTVRMDYTVFNDGDGEAPFAVVDLFEHLDAMPQPGASSANSVTVSGPIAPRSFVSGSQQFATSVRDGEAWAIVDTQALVSETNEGNNVSPPRAWSACVDFPLRYDVCFPRDVRLTGTDRTASALPMLEVTGLKPGTAYTITAEVPLISGTVLLRTFDAAGALVTCMETASVRDPPPVDCAFRPQTSRAFFRVGSEGTGLVTARISIEEGGEPMFVQVESLADFNGDGIPSGPAQKKVVHFSRGQLDRSVGKLFAFPFGVIAEMYADTQADHLTARTVPSATFGAAVYLPAFLNARILYITRTRALASVPVRIYDDSQPNPSTMQLAELPWIGGWIGEEGSISVMITGLTPGAFYAFSLDPERSAHLEVQTSTTWCNRSPVPPYSYAGCVVPVDSDTVQVRVYDDYWGADERYRGNRTFFGLDAHEVFPPQLSVAIQAIRRQGDGVDVEFSLHNGGATHAFNVYAEFAPDLAMQPGPGDGLPCRDSQEAPYGRTVRSQGSVTGTLHCPTAASSGNAYMRVRSFEIGYVDSDPSDDVTGPRSWP